MKKLFVLSLTLCLVVLLTSATSAATHPFTSDFTNQYLMLDFGSYEPFFDGWYTIEKEAPSLTFRGFFPDDLNVLAGEYFKDDQTFADIMVEDYDGFDNTAYIKGSYLFKNGFFAGLDYAAASGNSQVVISPGYRVNMNKNAYIAFSLDYAFDGDGYIDHGIVDYEIYGRYYTKQSRFYGQLLIPNEEIVFTDEPYLMAGGAVKVAKNVVLGANLIKNGDYDYIDFGATTSVDKLKLELQYAHDHNYGNVFKLNSLYDFTKIFRAGIQANKFVDADKLIYELKLAYTIDKQNSLKIIFQFDDKAAGYDDFVYLRWDIKL